MLSTPATSISSTRESSALTGLSSIALTNDRFANTFPYLKPSTNINALQGLFGLSGFHGPNTTRDFDSVSTLCPCTTVGSMFPHRPTATLLSSNALQFATQKCESRDLHENN